MRGKISPAEEPAEEPGKALANMGQGKKGRKDGAWEESHCMSA